jgi:hypothetical protein
MQELPCEVVRSASIEMLQFFFGETRILWMSRVYFADRIDELHALRPKIFFPDISAYPGFCVSFFVSYRYSQT